MTSRLRFVKYIDLADELAECLAAIIPSEEAIAMPPTDAVLLRVRTADIRAGIAMLERHRALSDSSGEASF
ncbi:MAG TPA: hypothetical protein VMZ51_08025 [Acidimicrobiales bacterium]|nr:hypothetical protein [Acidimicrobiales bacterium]